MDHKAVLKQLDDERRQAFRDGTEVEDRSHVTRGWHGIPFSQLTEATADAIITEQVAHYRAMNAEVEWTAYAHDSPPDLCQRLERHGFLVGQRESVLVLDLKERPAWIDQPRAYPVVRVTTVEQLELFQRVREQVFAKHVKRTISELERHLSAGSTHVLGYIAYDGDVPASIGRLYTHPRSVFGGLYGGGTIPSHRRKGLYQATVAARGRAAIDLGARYLRVDALPTSEPILNNLGFIKLTDSWPCILPVRPGREIDRGQERC